MQPLHRVELEWPDGSRCEIQAFKTASDGEPVVAVGGIPSVSVVTETANAHAHMRLAYAADPAGLFEPLRLFENVDYMLSLRIPGTVDENSIAARHKHGWPLENERVVDVVRLMPSRYWSAVVVNGANFTVVNGTMNFASFVGVVDLGFAGIPLRAEVASSKIDYFDDFRALLESVAEDLVDLLFEVDSVSGFRFSTADQTAATPATMLFHLRRVMSDDGLPAALESITKAPHSRLVEYERERPPALARFVEPDALAAKAARLPYTVGGPMAGLFRGHSPTVLVESVRHDTYDTLENRYVKAVMEDVIALLERLEVALTREKKSASAREASAWRDALEELLAEPLWREVGPLHQIPSNSQVLLRRDDYREVVQTDLLLQYGLVLPWERAEQVADSIGDIRPVFELYEYFCFFALRRVLRSVCGPETKRLEDFYTSRDGRLEVSLRRGKRSRVRYSLELAGVPVSVDLYYNRSFRKPSETTVYSDASYSAPFRPDFAVHVQAHGAEHWLLFDAKYRLDAENWLAEVTNELTPDDLEDAEHEDQDMFKKADLYKMHTYRDAVLGTRGAYLLFPGDGTDASIFVRHRDPAYRSSYSIPSVGAFPLRPRRTTEQEATLESFLSELFKIVAESSGAYVEESGVTL